MLILQKNIKNHFCALRDIFNFLHLLEEHFDTLKCIAICWYKILKNCVEPDMDKLNAEKHFTNFFNSLSYVFHSMLVNHYNAHPY